MKSNSVVRAAHKFINKSLKGKTDVKTITKHLNGMGYAISYYNIEDENELILKYKLDAKVKTSHAFSVVTEETKTTYLCRTLSAENKSYSLLHETGHIILGHLESNDIIVNDRLREMEAETFAYTVLNYKRSRKTLCFRIAVITVAMLISAYIGYSCKTKVIETSNQTNVTSDTVYITETGSKYHRKSCVYTKDKECIEVTKEQVQEIYEPCLVCNP